VVKLIISEFSEGHYLRERDAEPVDLLLDQDEPFNQPIHISFDIEKIGRNIIIKTKLAAKVDLVCDRCAEPFSRTITDTLQLIFTTDQALAGREEEDIFLIDEATPFVDITEPLRETLLLALPLKRLCDDECKGLCPSCGVNLNIAKCTCDTDHIDPRWEKLKELL